MQVLVVDDDEVVRATLAAMLRPLGAAVVQAGSGEEAWQLLEGGLRPTLCCSDVWMEELDGLGLARRVRGHPFLGDLPFILISSAADRETVEAAKAVGVAGFLVKPFRPVPTRATVEPIEQKYRLARSEPLAQTRRRLRMPLDTLGQMLQRLAEEAEALHTAWSQAEAQPADARSALQRLGKASEALGLWKCAAVLKKAGEDAATPPVRLLALREVRFLADEHRAVLQRDPAGAG